MNKCYDSSNLSHPRKPNHSNDGRLKELEEENRKFKQMYAELALDNKILLHVDIDRAVTGKGTAAFNVAGEG